MVQIFNLIITILTVAIFTRALLSFIVPILGNRPHPLLVNFQAVVVQLTEPLLAPLRRILPTVGAFDLSPMVALIILWAIRAVLVSRL